MSCAPSLPLYHPCLTLDLLLQWIDMVDRMSPTQLNTSTSSLSFFTCPITLLYLIIISVKQSFLTGVYLALLMNFIMDLLPDIFECSKVGKQPGCGTTRWWITSTRNRKHTKSITFLHRVAVVSGIHSRLLKQSLCRRQKYTITKYFEYKAASISY